MKIGFLTSYFYPFMGGLESNCYYLARELAKEHAVHIFTSDRKNGMILKKKEEIIDGIHVHRSKNWFRYRYYIALNPGLLFKVLKSDLDVLHVHSLGFIWHDFIVFLKKLFSRTKLINTPHGPFMALKDYNSLANIYKFILRSIEKVLNMLYDGAIEVNDSQYIWLVKTGFKKQNIFFVPNGIPKDTFKRIDVNVKNKYGIDNKLVISYIGRVQKYKGLDQVIRVLPYFPDVVFVIVGEDAGDMDRLERIARELRVMDRIIFTGRVSTDEKYALLDVSKIFILPSEWEAFGISMLEAMARGNVIISTKTEGGKFLIKKDNGFLYNFGDIEELKKILMQVLNDKERMDFLIEKNIKKSKEFLWEKNARKLEEVYKTIINR
ncbi:MAG: glycosyltransferase family 4 protein [Nanoarchaeota archaeon]